jgi:prevent-host-death family protein
MRTINIHEAKTQLSRLVEEAAKGEPFVIAKAGKPMVKVVPLDAPVGKKMQRFGFMKDVGTTVPDDFDRMFDADIEELFGLNDTDSK